MRLLLTVSYSLGFCVLAVYGLRALLLTLAYWRVRSNEPPSANDRPQPTAPYPTITVQLPIYNERYVAARVIDAACRLRWPNDRLEIQVLDDSTDETRRVVDDAAARWRARGRCVTVLRRAVRTGYKAGALAEGLTRARGSLIAVFDADFVPPPDFLARAVAHLGPDVGAVQARWAHLNRDASLLTRAQALALDGHFVVEQTARSRMGLMLNFNGSAGLWRRAAIVDAGGWQADTLSEDVDLSYRAQLVGWRIVFRPTLAAPAELPTTLLALKRQQRRWAKGTTQVLRKLGRRIWHADRPLRVRLHALLGLGWHLVHPLAVALLLGAPLLLVYRPDFHAALGLLTLLALCPPIMYAVAQHELHGRWARRLAIYPLLAVLSLGLSLNGALAVLDALRGSGGAFERTPKRGAAGAKTAGYALALDRVTLGELGLALYASAGLLVALGRDGGGFIGLFALFAAGYGLTAGRSLWEGLAGQRTGRMLRRRLRRLRLLPQATTASAPADEPSA